MNFEEPIMPPEGDGHGKRFESADLNMEDLKQYLLDTAFEDEDALVEELTKRYGMHRREGMSDMQMNMTRQFKKEDLKTIRRQIMSGEMVTENKGEPLSGKEPEEVLDLFLSTTDGNEFTLKIFQIENRNEQIRFEYTLE